LRAYQQAARAPRLERMPVVARAGRAVLRDYGGAGPPAVFVPSLINPPHILDLAEGNSLLRWLAANRVRPLLVDWGAPAPGEAELDVTGHVETMLAPLAAALGEPAHLVGYCLGGTMAAGAAALAAPLSLTLIATPWRFSGFPDDAREGLTALWEQAEPPARALGVLPMEVLQTAFWRLDPGRTVGKFEAFADFPPDGERARAFVALEDWANDGPPLTFSAARELIESLFLADATGRGEWRVGGKPVDPVALACPVLDIVSTSDRIVPAASASGAGERIDLAQGHVGMVVGGRARETLWEPLRERLSRTQPRG
ncbi:MAG: alpha/beta hydrolase, partial [Sphingomonadaceae bacterium]|nr:alpha/beta hydrolase [Sphingomonadaceae bacterium]